MADLTGLGLGRVCTTPNPTPLRGLPAVCIATLECTGSRSRERKLRLVRAYAWHCFAAGMPSAGAEDHDSPASAQPTPKQSLKHVMGVQTQGFAWVDGNKTTYDAHQGGWASAHVGDVLEIQARLLPLSLKSACRWLHQLCWTCSPANEPAAGCISSAAPARMPRRHGLYLSIFSWPVDSLAQMSCITSA